MLQMNIKNFARQTVNTHLSNVAIPGLRIIILDKADAMTSSAQSALRRTMERESDSRRFTLICNYVSRIMDPLSSRCAKLRLKPLSNQAQTERVKLIAKRENVTIEDDAITNPVSLYPPWKKFDILQQTSAAYNYCSDMNNKSEKENLMKMVKEVSTSSIDRGTLSLHIAIYENILEACGDKSDQKRIEKVIKTLSDPFPPTIQNPFEFVRQQNDHVSEPELANFKASQDLLSPNVSHKRNQVQKSPANEPLAKKDKKVVKERLVGLRDALLISPPIKEVGTNMLQISSENQASQNIIAVEKSKPEKSNQKTIETLRKGLNDADEKINLIEKENAQLKSDLKRAHRDITTLKKQLDGSVNKIEDLEAQLVKLGNDVQNYKNSLEADHDTIQTMEDQINELKQELQQYAAKQGIAVLFEGRKYTIKTVHGMAKLKTLGVADEKMGKVIETVLEMVDLTPNRVPSASTSARSWFYLIYLNRTQLLQVLLDAAKRDISTTLGSDETTKNGKKLEAFVLYTLDELNKAREYCLGMVDILDKSAATAVEKLKQIIQQLESEEGSNLFETFIMTVRNVISDQANTQKLFNNLLEAIKKVIVENDKNFDNMGPDEKQDLCKLRKYYCHLHILSNATSVITNALLVHEKRCRSNENITESSVVRIIKEVAKLTGQRASSRYDVHNKWMANAKHKNIKHANMPDFKGHRFMILLSIGGSIQYLKDDLLEFDKEFKTELRKVELNKWLNDPITSSHLLVIAAINEFITTPFWRLTEHDPSIDSITVHAQALINFLERVIGDPMLLLAG
uniref:Uncharacterized protein n=1 Tax=Panagrolaimus davidi TaxID=227884 RepID=A0A914PTH7_9BILA